MNDCEHFGVCKDNNCTGCPHDAKPRTVIAPGSNWPTRQVAEKKEQLKRAYSPRVPKEKPLDTSLDYFKEARDFIAPLIKDKGTTQIVRLYRDADGTIVGSEEVELVNQAVVGGANKYMGTYASLFNEGFRAAERIYGIGIRKKRTK